MAKQTDPTERLTRLQKKDPALVHENANKDSNVFNTQRDLTAGTVGKTLGLRLMPEHVAKAHLRGDIHYHDLDYTPWSPMTNCCLIDFREMLTNGFKIGNAEVESPHSIQTATAQMSQIIANVASSQYGGCSADRVDEVLEPFAMRNYEKHLAESKDYIENPEKQVEFAKKRTKKISTMRCRLWNTKSIPCFRHRTDAVYDARIWSWNFLISREIQKSILRIRIAGLGREKRTAIFRNSFLR